MSWNNSMSHRSNSSVAHMISGHGSEGRKITMRGHGSSGDSWRGHCHVQRQEAIWKCHKSVWSLRIGTFSWLRIENRRVLEGSIDSQLQRCMPYYRAQSTSPGVLWLLFSGLAIKVTNRGLGLAIDSDKSWMTRSESHRLDIRIPEASFGNNHQEAFLIDSQVKESPAMWWIVFHMTWHGRGNNEWEDSCMMKKLRKLTHVVCGRSISS